MSLSFVEQFAEQRDEESPASPKRRASGVICVERRRRGSDYVDLRELLNEESPPSAGRLSVVPPPIGLADLVARAQGVLKPDAPGKAVDLIYREVDAHFRRGDFNSVASLLDLIDVERLGNTVLLLAFVSISRRAREKLGESRTGFVQRARSYLEQTQPTRVEELLRGIE